MFYYLACLTFGFLRMVNQAVEGQSNLPRLYLYAGNTLERRNVKKYPRR